MPIASEVSIYIKRGDLIMGPFSETQTVKRYHSGEFRHGDLAMIDGMTGWHPLATYIVDEEDDSAPPTFDASAPPPIPRDEPPPRFDRAVADAVAISEGDVLAPKPEPRPDFTMATRVRSFGLVNPVGTAWALVGMAVVVMLLSRWPYLLWIPLVLGAITLAVHQLSRRNYAQAGPLLAVAILAPWVIFTQWIMRPASRMEKPIAAATPAPATPVRIIVAATPVPKPPKPVAEKTEPAAVAPEAVPDPAPAPVSKFNKGEYVALIRDTKLQFEGREFRLGKTGERFQVLAASPDKIYLRSKTARGQVIAITASPDLLKSVPAPGTSGPTIIE